MAARSGDRRAGTPRILMIAPSIYPPNQPEAIVNAKLALAMLDAGWQVDVVSDPRLDTQWYPTGHWRELRDVVHSVPPASGRLGLAAAAARSVLSGQLPGGFRWPVPAFREARRLARLHRYDCILSRAAPDFAHFAALLLARETGLPWIANWNDPQPWDKFPQPYGGGPSSRMTLRQRLFYREIVAACSWHTFPCERLRRYMCRYLPEVAGRSSVIPHVALDRFASPRAAHDGFVLCHAGSLRPPRDATRLLEGAKLFLDRTPGAELTLLFVVDHPEPVREAADRLGLGGHLRIEPLRPYEQMPDVFARSDVLVLVEADLEEGIFLPSKVADYCQSRLPILALSPKHGTVSDLFAEYGAGVAVDVGSGSAVAAGIGRLHDAWRRGTLADEFGSARLQGWLGEAAVMQRYRDLLDQVLDRSAERRRTAGA